MPLKKNSEAYCAGSGFHASKIGPRSSIECLPSCYLKSGLVQYNSRDRAAAHLQIAANNVVMFSSIRYDWRMPPCVLLSSHHTSAEKRFVSAERKGIERKREALWSRCLMKRFSHLVPCLINTLITCLTSGCRPDSRQVRPSRRMNKPNAGLQ